MFGHGSKERSIPRRRLIARGALDHMTLIPALTLAVMDAAIFVPRPRHADPSRWYLGPPPTRPSLRLANERAHEALIGSVTGRRTETPNAGVSYRMPDDTGASPECAIKGQRAIIEFTRAMRDTTGNLPPMPGVFPDLHGADRAQRAGRGA
jgi:hypothetical protein